MILWPRSLRLRLFVTLVAATGLVWALGATWITMSTNAKVEQVLDARLREAANMVSSLIDGNEVDLAAAADVVRTDFDTHRSYERQLSCQIWSLSGQLVGRSASAPEARLSDERDGYSERIVDGARWRVYSVRNEAAGVEVLVGDNTAFRDAIVRNMLLGLSVPMLLTLPLLAAILWLATGRCLAPLSRLAARLEARPAEDLAPLGEAGAVSETLPVVRALNGLFARVDELRGREREFLSVAAHELRTPLSGLRTQAEIAMRAPDETTRGAALERILTSVDRSSRLLRQLLTFGEADTVNVAADQSVALRPVIAMAADEAALRLEAKGGRLVLADRLEGVTLRVSEPLLSLAARNLVENAATYAGAGGTVWVDWRDAALIVEDDGPGMPADERARARGRFYRGSNRKGVGSGLGLSIVEVCARRMGARLILGEREGGGFSATLEFGDAFCGRD
ncbi:ATP-binding protein [Acuticoccus sp. M5D2P5]|uniref:ATP-binding protein n=1 Tax=Acuticoccus kalidii TaxID=2910977 RepID=UPI001F44D3F2|nr:ATP-binding protein [Acuticoccus kalidii]MCF3932937.1 ATP-binding protein [Acuticoccus kalidii]